jgi:DNA-binding beta-propeller fold protein YncE
MKTKFICVLLFLLLVGCTSQAPATPTATPLPVPPTPTPTPDPALQYVELVWSTTGGDDPLYQPSGMALDVFGNLFVVDTLNDRIRVFDPDGNPIDSWGMHGTGEGQFDFVLEGRGNLNLGAVAVDLECNVYVSDTGNNRIQKFDPQGNFLLQWGSDGAGEGQLFKVADIGIDPEGNLVVIDDNFYNFQKFDPLGNFLAAWGTAETIESRLVDVGLITFDTAGNLFAADPGTFAIFKFDPAGQLLNRWGKLPPTKEGGRSLPNGIALDTQGIIYITEVIDNRIMVFDPEGNPRYQWGSRGDGDYQFNGPHDILYDSQGYLYISDQFNNRVMKYRLLSHEVAKETETILQGEVLKDFPQADCCRGLILRPGLYMLPDWLDIPLSIDVPDGWRVMNEERAKLFTLVRGKNELNNPSELIVFINTTQAGSVDELLALLREEPNIIPAGEMTESQIANFKGVQQDYFVTPNPDYAGDPRDDIPPGVHFLKVVEQFFTPGFEWTSSSPEANLRFEVFEAGESILFLYLESPTDSFDTFIADASQILQTLKILEQ